MRGGCHSYGTPIGRPIGRYIGLCLLVQRGIGPKHHSFGVAVDLRLSVIAFASQRGVTDASQLQRSLPCATLDESRDMGDQRLSVRGVDLRD
jgi:hypothetical protein